MIKNKIEKERIMRAAFFTLGCKVNQYETQILMQQFSADGYDIVESEEEADVYIINSCTVTASGDKKTRQTMRKFKRQNPAAKIALTGCFPQAFPDASKELPEADVITGSYNRAGLIHAVKQAFATGNRVIDITPHKPKESFEQMQSQGFAQHTRAFIKIEDGCDRYCTYCIIPKARGPVRSKYLEDLKTELTTLAQSGYKEVVLVGINLSSYGKDIGLRLVDAVELACSVDGIERVRLGSLEPELLTDEDMNRLVNLTKFCPQFHLSLQSGADETLKRMNRHYDTDTYRNIVCKIREKFENPSITTDIMVGFPNENEVEFAQSLAFAKEIAFAKVHVFAYSIREGTKAATMENQVDAHAKELRSKQMIAVTDESRLGFLNAQIGLIQDVLFESTTNEYGVVGYTKNYTPVAVQSSEPLTGRILKVKIEKNAGEYCIGSMVSI